MKQTIRTVSARVQRTIHNDEKDVSFPELNRTPDLTGRNIVFLGGLHRSGTSILHRLLASHPSASGFEKTGVPEDEGQHLQTVFQAAKNFGGPGRFAFHPDAYLSEDDANFTSEADINRLSRQWGAHWNLSCDTLLEKSPPNMIRSRFFKLYFRIRNSSLLSGIL